MKICPDCIKSRQKIHDIEIQRGYHENELWPAYGVLMEVIGEYDGN